MKTKTYTDEQLKEEIVLARSWRDLSLRLGLCGRGGGAYKSIQNHVNGLKLDYSHFNGRGWSKNKVFSFLRKEVSFYLKKDGPSIENQALKKKLIENALKEDKCEECGQLPIWNNKPLTLHLDHKDGNNKNNELLNLRILCPHCHSQTENFCGKNKTKKVIEQIEKLKKIKPIVICRNCKKDFYANKYKKMFCCEKCYYESLRKVERPPYEQLIKDTSEMSFVKVGQKYGVSDNSIRKWLKFYEKEMLKT